MVLCVDYEVRVLKVQCGWFGMPDKSWCRYRQLKRCDGAADVQGVVERMEIVEAGLLLLALHCRTSALALLRRTLAEHLLPLDILLTLNLADILQPPQTRSNLFDRSEVDGGRVVGQHGRTL